MSRVKVKPLEWREDERWRWLGIPPFKAGNWGFWVMEHNGSWQYMGDTETYSTREEAMAAAQDEYEARILSGLDRQEAKDGVASDRADAYEQAMSDAATAIMKGGDALDALHALPNPYKEERRD